jgi:hypothetical protein|uniref:C2 domain-containing protein n=1 Tax=Fagus sylvatica TaxID=28930 RepID=A0A2N9FBB4_FAGSY
MAKTMATPPNKATVVEINLISAQELPSYKASSSTSSIRTYVVAWISPQQKLTSRVDKAGDKNPTWNDKFIVSIDKDLVFERPNSTLVLEIYCKRRYRKDRLIGKVNILLDSLIDKNQFWGSEDICGKVMAFHVRDSSGMPQGILNIGVMNLDGLLDRGMPSFLGNSGLAIDYRRLLGGN